MSTTANISNIPGNEDNEPASLARNRALRD